MHGGIKESISTSRIARKPVLIPSNVEIKIQNQQLLAKGPKGSLKVELHPFVKVIFEHNQVNVSPNKINKSLITGANAKLYRSIVGTTRANIQNIVNGVEKGYEKKLNLVGVGYRAQMKGKVLSLSLGFSHPTDFPVPEGITIETPTQTEILIKGINKEEVGKVAADIRKIRKPEPYKGKGVRYSNETIEIKETKKK